MKRKSAILFGATALWLVVVTGCFSHGDHTHKHDAAYEVKRQKSLEYLTENYPTREQTLQVRQCVTQKTGYKFPELPDDFGPEYLTKTKAEVIGDGQEPPKEVYTTWTSCIFDLGLEDRYYPPWDHEVVRNADDRARSYHQH